MLSRSHANLLDLLGDKAPITRPKPKRANTIANLTLEGAVEEGLSSVTSDAPSSINQDRLILVSNHLPVNATRRDDDRGWTFTRDEDALQLQMKDGLANFNADLEVLHVGCLKVEVDPMEQDEVSAFLLEKFNFVPVFLSEDIRNRFYYGFCKQYLWPLFHYMLPLSSEHGTRFDRALWQAYVHANRYFADKVMEVISPEDDFVWIHDYHLMVLPTFLRKRFPKVRMGFFLHSPFPSSEIYRTLPVRDEILRAFLNADLIGFHTFDYARHFLSCCTRILGLEYESKRGYIGLEYYGRTVGIKIMPVGVHLGQLSRGLQLNDTEWRIGELVSQYEGKTVLLGVDDMDIFKGIGLKMLAMESFLSQHAKWRGKAVLIQIANPARATGRDIEEVKEEVYSLVERINTKFGFEGYQPIVLLERRVPLYERLAFYTIAQCCVVTAVRDGMNLTPYEYVVVRERAEARGVGSAAIVETKKRSMLGVSEFIGCSPSLSGAIRVNPWNVEAVGEAMNVALSMAVVEQQMRHEKHYAYVSHHDVGFWAQSFMTDLQRTCLDHNRLRCYGIGFGLGFRVVALGPDFRKLGLDQILQPYRKAKHRAILLDYDGTMMPQATLNRRPGEDVIAVLKALCDDPANVVFLVSGRSKVPLDEWFADVDKLGIAAEHGYFYRWNKDAEWETLIPGQVPLTDAADVGDFPWKHAALPIMETYAESTDGSSIEAKDSALVWHYRDADPDFGSWQAKELLDHLESVLVNDPVTVKSGHHIVEVKPQGVSKGVVAEKVLATMEARNEAPDLILCIGDDRSDEDMFQKIEDTFSNHMTAQVFACTVGQKPSKAKYYLDDTIEVMQLLNGLANSGQQH